MDISNFDFNLPKSLIASRPLKPRSSAKLLFYEKSSIKDLIFFNLPDILSKNDLLVFIKLFEGVCLSINSPYPRIFVIYTELPSPNTTADIISTSKPKSSLLNGFLAFFHSPALYAQ